MKQSNIYALLILVVLVMVLISDLSSARGIFGGSSNAGRILRQSQEEDRLRQEQIRENQLKINEERGDYVPSYLSQGQLRRLSGSSYLGETYRDINYVPSSLPQGNSYTFTNVDSRGNVITDYVATSFANTGYRPLSDEEKNIYEPKKQGFTFTSEYGRYVKGQGWVLTPDSIYDLAFNNEGYKSASGFCASIGMNYYGRGGSDECASSSFVTTMGDFPMAGISIKRNKATGYWEVE